MDCIEQFISLNNLGYFLRFALQGTVCVREIRQISSIDGLGCIRPNPWSHFRTCYAPGGCAEMMEASLSIQRFRHNPKEAQNE
jgi:hypothetical protein